MSIKKSIDAAMSMQEQDNAILKATLGYAQLLGWAFFSTFNYKWKMGF